MDKRILAALVLSVTFLAAAFMGGDPPSARGFYYVTWLAFIWLLWKRRGPLETWLQSRTLPDLFLFVGLGLIMIIIEETIAGITVHLLSVKSPTELPVLVAQYYANNLLRLPGFIIAWYILLKRYEYSRTEVFTLVGLFGLFSEKIYIHVLTIPIMGIALLLPTMFTYIGIILPSILSLPAHDTRRQKSVGRYFTGLIFPIVMSMPFVFIHTLLTNAGWLDPTILAR